MIQLIDVLLINYLLFNLSRIMNFRSGKGPLHMILSVAYLIVGSFLLSLSL